jgi:hypothetical protein
LLEEGLGLLVGSDGNVSYLRWGRAEGMRGKSKVREMLLMCKVEQVLLRSAST